MILNDRPPERLVLSRLDTPIGEAMLVTDEVGVLRVFDWSDHEGRARAMMERAYRGVPITEGGAPAAVSGPLAAYFAGDIGALGKLAWRAVGTPFQREAWAALTRIPAGETRSYAAQAAAIGRPAAVRAVGLANGRNPIGVVVPCHRVIGADGSLTGYGGGLARKRWLLRHEGAAFRDSAGSRDPAAALAA